MSYANATRAHRDRFRFRREWLPAPLDYYPGVGLRLKGGGIWRSGLCPFHDDTHPSLSVNIETGAFHCHACGAKGRDILAFHQRHYALPFVEAAKALGAWEGTR